MSDNVIDYMYLRYPFVIMSPLTTISFPFHSLGQIDMRYIGNQIAVLLGQTEKITTTSQLQTQPGGTNMTRQFLVVDSFGRIRPAELEFVERPGSAAL